MILWNMPDGDPIEDEEEEPVEDEDEEPSEEDILLIEVEEDDEPNS